MTPEAFLLQADRAEGALGSPALPHVSKSGIAGCRNKALLAAGNEHSILLRSEPAASAVRMRTYLPRGNTAGARSTSSSEPPAARSPGSRSSICDCDRI